MCRPLLSALALCALAASPITLVAPTSAASAQSAQSAGDRDAVRRAVLDYVEGFYEGDTAKLVRSVRPEVSKYGFWRAKDSTTYAGEAMPWPEFLAYANRVKARNRPTPPTARKEVTVFEVQDQTASAKLAASWGTDYLLLGKYGGRWMVSHVLWQGPPMPSAAAAK
ncbi:MAG: nuclear transport factor 2 family protein [Gemmatimonadaceae bacterium]